jgi:hypothetical protein
MPDPRPLPQYTDSGLPWLIWFGRSAWECRRCGAGGRPERVPSGEFVRRVSELKRAHAGCVRRGGVRED